MHPYLLVFLISMVPVFELRAGIPTAYYYYTHPDPETFGEINLLLGYLLSALGNLLPVPFIFFFARRVLEWGKDKKVIGKFFTWCLKKGEKGSQKLQAKSSNGLYVALMFFVGIPLPVTGAWTGTLAASFLNMDFKKSMLAILGGVILASIIVGVLCLLGFSAWFGEPVV
ncbi:MAG: small multi-drug export protein [Bacteroidales bacterium]|nr:small multi-drug export protein [Bacteroidales bacterium]